MTASDEAFVFADSEVAVVSAEPGRLTVRFAAAQVVRPDAGTLEGRERGYRDGVSLHCLGAAWPAVPPEATGRLADGRVDTGEGWQHGLPLPFAHEGPARLELQFAHRTVLILEVSELRLTVDGGRSFVASLAC